MRPTTTSHHSTTKRRHNHTRHSTTQTAHSTTYYAPLQRHLQYVRTRQEIQIILLISEIAVAKGDGDTTIGESPHKQDAGKFSAAPRQTWRPLTVT